MKLYIKRDTAVEGGFSIFDELGQEKYLVIADPKNVLKFSMLNTEENCLSIIRYNRMMFDYFTIRCGRMYVLIPIQNDGFAFAIYGSTCHFAGNLAEGDFTLFSAEKEPVMTQKRSIMTKIRNGCLNDCWEVNFLPEDLAIYGTGFEIFALSTEICADMYLTNTAEKNGMILGC